MQMRHSPLAKSPPANLPSIPGVTSPAGGDQVSQHVISFKESV
jgi:hypothetical protein